MYVVFLSLYVEIWQNILGGLESRFHVLQTKGCVDFLRIFLFFSTVKRGSINNSNKKISPNSSTLH